MEQTSPIKHEYFQGEIYAMAGGSIRHNHIAANVLTHLRLALRNTESSAFGSDLRLSTPGGLFTYPDIQVICGEILLTPDRPETVVNPVVIFEVLSEATRDYDLGQKFDLYLEIPQLREYVVIEQDTVLLEKFAREETGSVSTRVHSLQESVTLTSIGAVLPLSAVYERVHG